ncbi:hypothetical protein ACOSQ2_022887 [Xanthoceras sorbifolium]
MVWSRGPWYFDKNLIVLEKPVGSGEDTSDAIPKAQEDIEHVAGIGAEGASRSLSTIPSSSDKRGGKSSRDLGVSEPNRALIADDGISTQIMQPVISPSREALARMDDEIVGSNLCDEGDVVMVGSSCGKPNSKKWKRLIRGSPLQRLIPGCPSPIQKMLLARHYARRDRKPVKRSLKCYSVICTAWRGFDSETSGGGLRDKLVLCADRLENWSKVKFGSLKKAIDRKRGEINLLYDRKQSEQVLNAIKCRERELESLLSKEELYWKQRSRVDWLLAGDKNSKFFHRRATVRKKKNQISSLLDNRGVRRESEQGMSSVVLDYFSDLFRSIQPSSSNLSAATSFLESKDFMVASLISPSSHSWDLAKLDQVFVTADRDSILEIPLSLGDCADSLIWHFDKTGEYSRNAVFHSKSPRVSADLVSWSLSLLREFQSTQKVFGSPSQPPRLPCSASWLPPPAGSLKLNTDAAVKPGFSVMGSGAVVRDS